MPDREAIMKCVRGITSYVNAGDFLLAEQVTRRLLLLLGAPSSELTIPEDVWRENDALDVPETTINGCEMHLDDRRPATVCTCGTPRRNLYVRDVCDRCQRPIPLYR